MVYFVKEVIQMKIVSSRNIQTMNHVQHILESLSAYIKNYEEVFGEASEDECFDVEEQLCEIDEFIIRKQKCTEENAINADIRKMCYWKYIEQDQDNKQKYDFNALIEDLKLYEREKG